MTLSLALHNALSGLQANTQKAEVISTNVANALTDGFGRREVALSSLSTTGGVRVDGIIRASSPVLAESRRFADAASGSASVRSDAYTRLADAIGEPGAPGALATIADDFDAALSAAADTPESAALLKGAVLAAGDYAASINRIAAEVINLRASADTAIAGQVQTINSSLRKIQSLNAEIKTRELSGGDISALLDQRESLIKEVSSMIPIRTVMRPFNEIALYAANGGQLLDGKAYEIGFTASPGAAPGATLANGGLSGITLNGVPIAIGEGSGDGLLDGGSLAASFEVRDQIAPETFAMLDGLAAGLITRVQDLPEDGTLTPGDPGLFTDAGTAFDPADEFGVALRIALNPQVDQAAGGDAFRLRDGLNAASPGVVGDATILRGLKEALVGNETPTVGSGLTGARSAAGFAAELSVNLLTDADRAQGAAMFEAGSANALREAELAETGVDTDQELSRLLQVEQAFSANARVVSVVDELFDRLLQL